jgi:hypothetical protein
MHLGLESLGGMNCDETAAMHLGLESLGNLGSASAFEGGYVIDLRLLSLRILSAWSR